MIAVNFMICKLCCIGVKTFMWMCVTDAIMLCGAAPTCMFPHSEIPPSSSDHLPHLDHDYKWQMKKKKDHFEGYHTHCVYLCLIKMTLPSICVRNGMVLLSFYLVKEGGEYPPGLPQLITATETGGAQVKHTLKQNAKTIKYDKRWFHQPTDKVHLISTEDIQY